jgi:hypothetical protein
MEAGYSRLSRRAGSRGLHPGAFAGLLRPRRRLPRLTMDTAVNSREYRVLFFCPAASAHERRLEVPVRRLLSRIEGPPAELAPVQDATELKAGGWHAYEVRSTSERSAAHALAAYVAEVTCAIAAELDAEVLGLYVDVDSDGARLCKCGPSEGPETFAGRREAVLLRAGEWLGLPATALTELFAIETDGEPDADDRFVEEKLKEARALMQRYRDARRDGS